MGSPMLPMRGNCSLKLKLLNIYLVASTLSFILTFCLFLYSFASVLGGAQFIGSFINNTVRSASSRPPFVDYDIHHEYRGLFLLNGWLSVGTLVVDTRIGVMTPFPPTQEGFRYLSGIPTIAFSNVNQPRWNVLDIDSVDAQFGNGTPQDYYSTQCVRIHTGWLMLATFITPALWIIRRTSEGAIEKESRRDAAL